MNAVAVPPCHSSLSPTPPDLGPSSAVIRDAAVAQVRATAELAEVEAELARIPRLRLSAVRPIDARELRLETRRRELRRELMEVGR